MQGDPDADGHDMRIGIRRDSGDDICVDGRHEALEDSFTWAGRIQPQVGERDLVVAEVFEAKAAGPITLRENDAPPCTVLSPHRRGGRAACVVVLATVGKAAAGVTREPHLTNYDCSAGRSAYASGEGLPRHLGFRGGPGGAVPRLSAGLPALSGGGTGPWRGGRGCGWYLAVAGTAAGCRGRGEGDLDGEAAAGPRAGGEGGVVRGCDGLGDGQAQAVPVRLACPAGGEPVEGLEEPLGLAAGYRGPGVGHEQDGAAGFEGGHDLDPAAGDVVPDGVVCQVGDQPPGQAGVAVHGGGGEGGVDGQLPGMRLRAVRASGGRDRAFIERARRPL